MIRDLELYRFGFSYIEPSIQQGAAFRDGTCVVIQKDLDKTCASLARFSARDAETFRELHFLYAVQMRPLFTSLAFNAPLPIDQLKDRLSGAQAKEFLSHTQHDLFSVVRKHFDEIVFDTIIHRNTKISEAPSVGKPVILYDALSKGSVNYLNLAKEILQKNNLTKIRQEERILE